MSNTTTQRNHLRHGTTSATMAAATPHSSQRRDWLEIQTEIQRRELEPWNWRRFAAVRGWSRAAVGVGRRLAAGVGWRRGLVGGGGQVLGRRRELVESEKMKRWKIVMNNESCSQFVGAEFTDRLSALPDAILDQILSLVDTKTVVQTSVLSRRWRSVWKHVHALNLDYGSFGRCYSSFATFVDKVLALRDPLNLNKISYCSGYTEEEAESIAVIRSMVVGDPLVVRIVKYAVRHGASSLMLDMDYDLFTTNAYRFSESYTSLFECDLKTLSLGTFEIDDRFGSFGFRGLTEMRLVSCLFQSDEEILDPFSKFPCLRKLVLDTFHSIHNDYMTFRISGPQLHHLELLNMTFGGMQIYAPKLKSFKLRDVDISSRFAVLYLPSLDHACFQSVEEASIVDWVFTFQGCHNAKSLTLCDSTIEALCKISGFLEQRPSPFTRLEHLNLTMKLEKIPYKLLPPFVPSLLRFSSQRLRLSYCHYIAAVEDGDTLVMRAVMNKGGSSELGRTRKWRPSTDRLSHLPEAILYHILTFIDTKTVVQTSVLSRRWKCVWKHVPALNLDFESFRYCHSRFARFVDKVLSLRYPLNVNRIIYINGYTKAEAEECSLAGKDLLVVKVIKYAASHGTRHLNLDHCYVDEPLSKSYASISECDLETLSLCGFEIDNRLQSFGFRMLTEMSLEKCNFWSDQELPDPFSKFPCLKSLVLEMFYWDVENRRRFRIFGPQLHNLKLSLMSVSGLEISAPKLKSLAIHDLSGSLDFSKLNLPSLEHVDIQFEDSDVDEVLTVKEEWDILFRGFHNVKSLTLCTTTVEILCKFSGFLEQRPSPFTRLEYLNLTKNPCPKSIPFKVIAVRRRWYSRFATFVDKVLSLRCPLKLNKIIYISGYREEEEAESKDDFGAIFDPLVTRVVEYAVSHGASHLRISGPQLHNLEVSNIAVERIEISAPNLKSFKLCNIERSIKFSELDLPCLDCANIDCVVEDNISVEDWDLLFQGCHNAKSLTLCALTMELLPPFVPSLLRFSSHRFRLSYCHYIAAAEDGDPSVVRAAKAEEYSLARRDLLAVRVIKYAASHGTRHLNLQHVHLDHAYRLSKSYASISECDLKTLSLGGFEIDNRLQSFGFRLLTEISLIKCDFRSDEELPDPFSKFPCLKSLVLEGCIWDLDGIRLGFKISGPQLHNLNLSSMSVSGLKISAPKLKSLAVHDLYYSVDFSELNLPSLEHADIQFEDYDEVYTSEEDWDITFSGCHNVKSLTLCAIIIEELCEISEFLEQRPSPFTRLEYLNLTKNPKSIPFKLDFKSYVLF
ncbi:F-box/FBD/LRR-repeat protein At5g56420 [Linum perenne]